MLEMAGGGHEMCHMCWQELRDDNDRGKREAKRNDHQVRQEFEKETRQMLKESEGPLLKLGRNWFKQKIEEAVEKYMEVVINLYIEQLN